MKIKTKIFSSQKRTHQQMSELDSCELLLNALDDESSSSSSEMSLMVDAPITLSPPPSDSSTRSQSPQTPTSTFDDTLLMQNAKRAKMSKKYHKKRQYSIIRQARVSDRFLVLLILFLIFFFIHLITWLHFNYHIEFRLS